ncbi:MAG: protoporphyrinogen oxidase [Acidimicrobiia bacterium]|nr:protoporphyrinogen oxidase [Acidimicrobiia bacterium]
MTGRRTTMAGRASAEGGRPRVVVVGAGLSGLTAAERLCADRPDLDVVVVDAADRAGGKILTTTFNGIPLDCAADAFLARVPEGLELCRRLGLAEQLVSPAQRSAFVWSHGRLRRLPEGLVLGVPTDLDALEASGIVSSAGVARAAEDLERTTPPARHHVSPDDAGSPSGSPSGEGTHGGADESVGALVRRHLGDEVTERLVAPLLGGVNAGDADDLSVAAGAPQLAAAAASDQASLIRGLRRQLAERSDPDAPVFFGLPQGTTTLITALVRALPAGTVRLGWPVQRLTPLAGGGFRLDGPDGDLLEADAVVMAVPSFVAARLLGDLGAAELDAVVDGLASLEWASVAMVSLAVPTDGLTHPLDGSGYLVPAPERAFVTACSFASSKWAHLRRDGTALLRVSAGHAGDGDDAVQRSDEDIVAAVCADLRTHIGLEVAPTAVRITRWPTSLPQYRPGHLERCRSWQQTVAATLPGVWLTGASFEGLGLPACIRQGTQAATEAAAAV